MVSKKQMPDVNCSVLFNIKESGLMLKINNITDNYLTGKHHLCTQ